MPKFYEMVEVEAEVWIDVEEFVNECSEKEVNKLIKVLVEDGHIKRSEIKSKNQNLLDEMWQEKVEKILNNRLALTEEEIILVERIATRL
jgi:hypothetical protein